jgi:hypothetical protein
MLWTLKRYNQLFDLNTAGNERFKLNKSDFRACITDGLLVVVLLSLTIDLVRRE